MYPIILILTSERFDGKMTKWKFRITKRKRSINGFLVLRKNISNFQEQFNMKIRQKTITKVAGEIWRDLDNRIKERFNLLGNMIVDQENRSLE